MEMMKNVVVKSDLEGLKDEMLKEADRKTKVAISEAIDPLKNEMSDVKADVANIKSQISHAEKKNSDENNMLANKIKGIEAAIAHLKISPAQGGNDQATAVIGGLESA
jgi:chromosome segregation ATPase